MKIHLKKKISDSFRIKKKYLNLYLDHLHILEFSIVCLHLILFDSLFLVMMRNDITDPINEKANPNSLSSKFAFPWAKSVNRTCMSGPIPEASNNGTNILDCCQLETDGQGSFVDNKGRKIVLKGINVDGALKFPCTPNLPSYAGNGSEPDNIFFEGEQVLFVGRPFPLEEAEVHFERIKSWGYNTIRYLITWEALEHFGPCKYDDDFIAYTIDMLRIINRVGGFTYSLRHIKMSGQDLVVEVVLLCGLYMRQVFNHVDLQLQRQQFFIMKRDSIDKETQIIMIEWFGQRITKDWRHW